MGDKDTVTETPKWVLPVIIGMVICIWLATPVVHHQIYSEIEHAGQLGDIFGSANALFSAFALIGVVYAILLQMKELELQRKELRETKNIHKEIMEAQQESEKELSRQVELMMFTAHLEGLREMNQHWNEVDTLEADYERNLANLIRRNTVQRLQERLSAIAPDYHEQIRKPLSWRKPLKVLSEVHTELSNVAVENSDYPVYMAVLIEKIRSNAMDSPIDLSDVIERMEQIAASDVRSPADILKLQELVANLHQAYLRDVIQSIYSQSPRQTSGH